jgi:hypothetical protein
MIVLLMLSRPATVTGPTLTCEFDTPRIRVGASMLEISGEESPELRL